VQRSAATTTIGMAEISAKPMKKSYSILWPPGYRYIRLPHYNWDMAINPQP
jgi:hypothetical protein